MKILFVTESAARRKTLVDALKNRFGAGNVKDVAYGRFKLDHQQTDPVSLVIFDMEPAQSIRRQVLELKQSEPAPSWCCIYPGVAPAVAEGALKMGAIGCLNIPEYQLAELKFMEPFLDTTLSGLPELKPSEEVETETPVSAAELVTA